MLLDYHQKFHPDGHPFTVQSINKHLRVSKKWGCEESDIENFLERFEIGYTKVRFHQLESLLKQKKPILSLYQDELHDGHYGLLVGQDQDHYFFHDPWPDFGPYFRRQKKTFAKQAKVFNNWFLTLD